MISEPIQKTFISAQSLLQDSFALGLQVLKSGFRPTFLVGVWRGGAPIGITVQEVLEYLRRRCRRNLPDQIKIATVYYKPSRNQSSLRPDYFVRETDHWLVFPHEICGLSREEIMKHKPVSADFLSDGH